MLTPGDSSPLYVQLEPVEACERAMWVITAFIKSRMRLGLHTVHITVMAIQFMGVYGPLRSPDSTVWEYGRIYG